MAPVHDLLEYYLSLANVHDTTSLTLLQRQTIVILMLHDFFSEHISMIDVCSMSQYLAFEADPEKADETDLEYILWCCCELIPTEDQHKIYDQPRQPHNELISKLQEYVIKNQHIIDEIILDRSTQKLVA